MERKIQNLKSKTFLLVVLILLDQLSKYWAIEDLKTAPAINVLDGFLELRYAENTGVAFSFLESQPLLLTIVISIALVFLTIELYRKQTLNLAFVCILAGGYGNLIDRFQHGFVIDFINPTFIDFAIFNFADVLLNIGVYLLILQYILEMRKKANGL